MEIYVQFTDKKGNIWQEYFYGNEPMLESYAKYKEYLYMIISV